jgi:hypothetical protein
MGQLPKTPHPANSQHNSFQLHYCGDSWHGLCWPLCPVSWAMEETYLFLHCVTLLWRCAQLHIGDRQFVHSLSRLVCEKERNHPKMLRCEAGSVRGDVCGWVFWGVSYPHRVQASCLSLHLTQNHPLRCTPAGFSLLLSISSIFIHNKARFTFVSIFIPSSR